jgi:hypothetical protein
MNNFSAGQNDEWPFEQQVQMSLNMFPDDSNSI